MKIRFSTTNKQHFELSFGIPNLQMEIISQRTIYCSYDSTGFYANNHHTKLKKSIVHQHHICLLYLWILLLALGLFQEYAARF